MRLKLFLGLLVGAILAPTYVFATPQRIADQRNIIFDRIGSDQGLSQGIVTVLAQDPSGFVWVGTQEGLNRYDGFQFETYYHIEGDASSLSHDYVRALLFNDEEMWVASDGGLDLFDASLGVFSKMDIGQESEEKIAFSLLKHSSGDVWVGTAEGLVVISRDGSLSWRREFEVGNWRELLGAVRVLFEDSGGKVWVGTEQNGLFSVEPGGQLTRNLIVPDDANVRDIIEDKQGRFWIATFDSGVFRYNPMNSEIKSFSPKGLRNNSLASNRIRALLEDQDGQIWFGTDRGLHLWLGGDEFSRYVVDLSNPRSISDDAILELFQDKGGVIWVGTFNGISKWNASIEMFPYFRRPATEPGDAQSNNITSFADDGYGNVWIGTFAGLMQWDVELGELRSHDPENMNLIDQRVMSLAVVDQAVWTGTASSGVNVVEDGMVTQVYRHSPYDAESISSNAITRIYTDHQDRVWVATYGAGVNQYLGDGRFRRFPGEDAQFPDLRCMDIVEVENGEIWVSTQGGGVVILDPSSGDTRLLQHNPEDSSSLPSNEVLTLLPTKFGVWIGTVNRGLSFFDHKTESFVNFTKKDGLASDSVYGLLEDGERNIWISGGKGLSMYDPSRKKFARFDSSHGLQSSDFNSGAYARLSDGSLIFGGNNGFNAFYPDRIKLNSYVPPVHITNFKLFNESVLFTETLENLDEIQLSHDDSVVSFSFAALDYTAPAKNQYRYKLEGFDREWIQRSDNREATYTNLDSGKYVFRVQGSNNDGIWNERGASLSLIVHPAPWLTWWAYCMYIGLVALGFYLLFRINSGRLQREAERQYSEQLQLYIESLEEASDSILIADSEGVLIYANNTIVEGLNKSPSEVIGKSLWEVLFEDESDVLSAQRKLVEDGRFHGEVILADPTDEAKTHEVTIAAVQQSSSNKQAYVGISRDITQRKVAEVELEDYRKNLEHLVEERTAALQNEIAENKAIQVHLSDSLQEKELLIKEVHHRVKNNMQIISSLLSIQAEGAGDEVYSTLLNESQQRIKSMALIHETLYQSKDLLNIDFQEYIESLTNSLSRSYVIPGVSVYVDVKVENVLLDLETAVPCGLVINELVSNALKHAFQGKEGTGIISIDFVTNDCTYDLRISDNGVGLPPDFDIKKNTSMGLEIVTILTAQLEGALTAHNEDGAVFQIQFPRAAHV